MNKDKPEDIVNLLLAQHLLISVEKQDILLTYIRDLENLASRYAEAMSILGQLEDLLLKPQYVQAAARVNAYSRAAQELVIANNIETSPLFLESSVVLQTAIAKYNSAFQEAHHSALADLLWLLKNLSPIIQAMQKFADENPGSKTP